MDNSLRLTFGPPCTYSLHWCHYIPLGYIINVTCESQKLLCRLSLKSVIVCQHCQSWRQSLQHPLEFKPGWIASG